MKTYKKGISLIVLVITVIVLSILATTVIISLSNTNIITKAGQTVFKSDMSNYKEMYQLYLTDKLLENSRFNKNELSVSYGDEEYTKIFGENVPEKYQAGLKIASGKMIYETENADEIEVLQELGISNVVIIDVSEISVGDLVAYTPNANELYVGYTYSSFSEDSSSDRFMWEEGMTGVSYGNYIRETHNYTQEDLKWIYLGHDENGNILLTSQEPTTQTVNLRGGLAHTNGPSELDALCNGLYGNADIGTVRNMKVEDVNLVLGYPSTTGYLGSYNSDGSVDEITGFWIDTPLSPVLTIGELIDELNIEYTADVPDGSTKSVTDYLLNKYTYVGSQYRPTSSNEYKAIFNKEDGTISQNFWLSSSTAYFVTASWLYNNYDGFASFGIRFIESGEIKNLALFEHQTPLGQTGYYMDGAAYSLRPVVVLNSNIVFGAKNESGEWTLVQK